MVRAFNFRFGDGRFSPGRDTFYSDFWQHTLLCRQAVKISYRRELVSRQAHRVTHRPCVRPQKTETVSREALDSTNSLTPWSCGWCLTEGQRIGDQCRSTGFFYHRGEQLSCKCNKKAARTQNFGSITLKHGQASRT